MVTALVLPCSGPYTGQWNSGALGVLNDDGFRLTCTVQGQEVNETDVYGLTLVEAIYQGQNWRCRLVGLEWSNTVVDPNKNTRGLLGLLQMFGAGVANLPLEPILLNIGDRWSKFCQSLVLSAILSNPPTTPQSLTALGAGLAPQQASNTMMTSKVRELPLELVFLPYVAVSGSDSGRVIPFSVT